MKLELVNIALLFCGIVLSTEGPVFGEVTVELQRLTYEVSEGDGSISICAVITGSESALYPIHVLFTTADSTADEDDYSPISKQMIFEFKEVIQCVEIFITDDDAYEQVEEFSVLLSNPSQDTTLGVAQSTVMITDNDNLLWKDFVRKNLRTVRQANTGSCADAGITECCAPFSLCNLAENDCGCDVSCFIFGTCCNDIVDLCVLANIVDDSLNIVVEEGDTEDFCITVDTPQFVLTREITINVTVIEGNAENNIDYTGLDDPVHTLTFMPGTTGTQVQCIQLVITNDGEPEGREFFRIRATSSDPGVFIPSIASTSRIEINEGRGSCVAAGFQGCCTDAFQTCNIGECFCNISCFEESNCCNDIPDICLPVQSLMNVEVNETEQSIEVCAISDIGIFQLSREIEVQITTQDGTAVDGVDYNGVATALTFFSQLYVNGTATVCTNIDIIDDTLVERTEFFIVELDASQSVAVIPSSNSTIRIYVIDNDNIDVSFEQMFYQIPEESLTNNLALYICATVANVDLNDPATIMQFEQSPVKVSAQTVSITAEENVDYKGFSEVLVFEDPRLPQCICIPIFEDRNVEGNELFSVELQSLQNFVSSNVSTAVVTVTDNDVGEVSFELQAYTISEDAGIVEVCALITGEVGAPLSITLTTQNGTALAGEDYIFIEAIAIFTPGSPLRQCVNITIINDPIEEEDESFTVALGASSDSITVVNSSTMVTILRNDFPIVTVGFAETMFIQDENTTVEICALQTAGVVVNQTFTVELEFSMVGSTAEVGNDFEAVDSTFVFNDTVNRNCVNLQLLSDAVIENTDTLNLGLSSAFPSSELLLSPNTATVSIIDITIIDVQFEQNEYSISEDAGILQVCVVRSDSVQLERSITVILMLEEGTAISLGQDYNRTNQQVTFTPSDVRVCSPTAIIINDTIPELHEFFFVLLSSTDSAVNVIGDDTATVTILNDDGVTVELQQDAYSIREDEGAIQICIDTFGDLNEGENAVVTLTTIEDSAEPGSDYTEVSTDIAIPFDAPDFGCVSIMVINDEVFEETQSFIISLTSTDPLVTLTDNTATTIYITDDDAEVVFTFDRAIYQVNEGASSVRVCVGLSGEVEFTVFPTLITQDETAEAGVDYTPLTQPLSFNPSQTNLVVCVMVTILEDDRIEEGGETFLMVLTSDSGVVALASRTVQILDNDVPDIPLIARLIDDTPAVDGTTVAVAFEANLPMESATCQIPGSEIETQDCISGSAVFNSRSALRRRPFSLTIEVTATDGQTETISRNFIHLDSNGLCSAHLVNDGSTISAGSVTIEWQLTGPSAENRTTLAQCFLDDNLQGSLCSSPFTLSGIASGTHTFVVRPLDPEEQECIRRVGLTVMFVL